MAQRNWALESDQMLAGVQAQATAQGNRAAEFLGSQDYWTPFVQGQELAMRQQQNESMLALDSVRQQVAEEELLRAVKLREYGMLAAQHKQQVWAANAAEASYQTEIMRQQKLQQDVHGITRHRDRNALDQALTMLRTKRKLVFSGGKYHWVDATDEDLAESEKFAKQVYGQFGERQANREARLAEREASRYPRREEGYGSAQINAASKRLQGYEDQILKLRSQLSGIVGGSLKPEERKSIQDQIGDLEKLAEPLRGKLEDMLQHPGGGDGSPRQETVDDVMDDEDFLMELFKNTPGR